MIRRLFISLAFALIAAPVWAEEVVIFAASSLKSALDEVTQGMPVRISYGGSGLLARQLLQGAPADIFFSANVQWMDAAIQGGAVAADSRVEVVSNRLVAVSGHAGTLDDLLAGDGHVATGLVGSVPAGIYAKAYLEAAGQWEKVAPRLIETDSARAALTLAARKEVPFAIVYASDVVAQPAVQLVHMWPVSKDLPIRYPVALTARANAGAKAVLDALQTKTARSVFTAHGFGVP